MAEIPERNLGLDLVRVTETAAMAAARWQGRGDKDAVDRAAVDAMRAHLATLDIDGIVVIGEGEKDNAPMLYNGERVGSGSGPEVDVAVDPVDGTRLTAEGGPGALAVLVVSERGTMYAPGQVGLHGQARRGTRGGRDHRPRCPGRLQPPPGGQGAGQGRQRPPGDHPRPAAEPALHRRGPVGRGADPADPRR